MPRDANGNYTLPAGNPVVAGTTIDTSWANPTMEDIANEITNSLSRDGEGGMLVPFLNIDGSVGQPGMSWINQVNTGFYRAGASDMRVSIGGIDNFRWDATGAYIWNTVDLAWEEIAVVGDIPVHNPSTTGVTDGVSWFLDGDTAVLTQWFSKSATGNSDTVVTLAKDYLNVVGTTVSITAGYFQAISPSLYITTHSINSVTIGNDDADTASADTIVIGLAAAATLLQQANFYGVVYDAGDLVATQASIDAAILTATQVAYIPTQGEIDVSVAKRYLKQTNYHVIRHLEDGTVIPALILQGRIDAYIVIDAN